jgi:hypothetical protein
METPCATCSSKGQSCTYERLPSGDENINGMSEQKTFSSIDDVDLTSPVNVLDAQESTCGQSNTVDPLSLYGPLLFDDFSPSDLDMEMMFVPGPSGVSINQGSPRNFDFLIHFTKGNGLENTFNYEPKGKDLAPPSKSISVNETESQKSPHSEAEWLWEDFGLGYRPDSWLNETNPGGFGALPSPNAAADDSRISKNMSALPESCAFSFDGVPHQFPILISGNPSSVEDVSYSSFEASRIIEWLSDPLFAKTKEIWDSFRQVTSAKGNNTVGFTSAASARCLEFFCPSKIKEYTNLFWDRWYPNCPIIHRPTFDALQTSNPLLTTMVLIGACMSPNMQEAEEAREWLDITEEVCFQNDWLSRGHSDSLEQDEQSGQGTKVRALQAAFFALVLQNWDGTDDAKRRTRRRRYTTLIAVSLRKRLTNLYRNLANLVP